MNHSNRQCPKCPWKVGVNPHDIPRGYSTEKHEALSCTIAREADPGSIGEPLRVMACHENHTAACVGWLHHQLGPGNNLALRLSVLQDHTPCDYVLDGEQHPNFEATLPEEGL